MVGSAGSCSIFWRSRKHVNVHCAVGDGAILAPHRVEQLLAAENHSRTAHQELQQPELGGRQRQRTAV